MLLFCFLPPAEASLVTEGLLELEDRLWELVLARAQNFEISYLKKKKPFYDRFIFPRIWGLYCIINLLMRQGPALHPSTHFLPRLSRPTVALSLKGSSAESGIGREIERKVSTVYCIELTYRIPRETLPIVKVTKSRRLCQ